MNRSGTKYKGLYIYHLDVNGSASLHTVLAVNRERSLSSESMMKYEILIDVKTAESKQTAYIFLT